MSTIAVKQVKLGNDIDPSKNFVISVPAVADGTLTIKREDGTNVLSIAANGKAVIPGVVGTVAQVGGVPTGQVVERGSNANGHYTRFADGMQICVHQQTFSDITNVYGNIYSSGQGDWSFPAAFSSPPTYTGADGRAFGGTWASSGPASVTTGSASFQFLRSVSYAGQFVGHLVAIGRWF